MNVFENSSITFNAIPIDKVYEFKYMGTGLFKDWASDKEIKCHIEQSRANGIGRKTICWLRNIRHWTELKDIKSLICTARNREAMENVVANIH